LNYSSGGHVAELLYVLLTHLPLIVVGASGRDRAKLIDSYSSPTTVVDVLRECTLFLFTKMLKLILAGGYLKTFENSKSWRSKLDHAI
jgi:hypothetical protein